MYCHLRFRSINTALTQLPQWDRRGRGGCGGGVVDLYRVCVGEQRVGIILSLLLVFVFSLCFCILFFYVLPVSFFSAWSMTAGVCFFVYYLFSFSLVSSTRSYWCIEIVVCHVKLFCGFPWKRESVLVCITL